MTTQEKFRTKRLGKEWKQVGITCILLGIFSIVIFSTCVPTKPPISITIAIIISIAVPFMAGFVAFIFAAEQKDKLLLYKRQIQTYRQQRMFLKVLDCLEKKDLNQAKYIHNTYLHTNTRLRQYSYCFIVGMLLFSRGNKRKAQAKFEINKVREFYSLDNIFK